MLMSPHSTNSRVFFSATRCGKKPARNRNLGCLPLFARRPAREVAADHRELALGRVEAQFEVAAFGVELLVAPAHDDVAGHVPGVDGGAGVAFLLGEMKVPPQAGHLLEAPRDIARLDADLLHANTIRRQLRHPVRDAFGGGRAQAVEVEAGQFEHEDVPMGF